MIAADVRLGAGVVIHRPELVNLYGCTVGADTRIGAFVEIQKKASVGRRCKISSHSFICEGVTIEDEVFVGHGVMFINDRYPRATAGGRLQTEADWQVIPIRVKRGASIGSGAVVMCGVTIGEEALVGAGAVVTHDVPDGAVVLGMPARVRAGAHELAAGPLECEPSDGRAAEGTSVARRTFKESEPSDGRAADGTSVARRTFKESEPSDGRAADGTNVARRTFGS